ncbi:hypothetical protein ACFYUV_11385 [Nonomuraea sp. NPDC003560]|uniref:hypothetical protein n=1 Tax=Nonomuraea sp. NPDC003560 TaxID=3364341 RepID=UPI0036B861D7
MACADLSEQVVTGHAAGLVLDGGASRPCEAAYSTAVALPGEGGAAAAVDRVFDLWREVVVEGRDNDHDGADHPHLVATGHHKDEHGRSVLGLVEGALLPYLLDEAAVPGLTAVHDAAPLWAGTT